MNYSLNEVDVMAKRAVRGAGYSWGLAEDAGKAVRWLCAHDLDGCASLKRVLEHSDRAHWPAGGGLQTGVKRAEKNGVLCPLIVGATISDSAHILRDGPIQYDKTIEPILILPFMAIAARQIETTVTLICAEMIVVTDGKEVGIEGRHPDDAEEFTIGLGGGISTPRPSRSRARPTPDTWAALDQFSQRTFAPATKESRLKGAGSGILGND